MGERHNNPGRARREYAAYLASTTPEQRRAEAERERYEYSLTTARNDAYRACSAADRDAYERVKDAMQRAETHAQCVWAAEKRKQAQKDTQQ